MPVTLKQIEIHTELEPHRIWGFKSDMFCLLEVKSMSCWSIESRVDVFEKKLKQDLNGFVV